jgi:cysteine-rich repeat protein
LAQEATKGIIDTLVDTDFVAIVRFSSTATSNSDQLQRASNEVKAELAPWIQQNIQANGGTNFKTGFQQAFNILSRSRTNGATAGCKSVILFLSDGDPSDWDEASYPWLAQKVEDVGDTIVFTYGLGSGLSANGIKINKRIACENRGIFHRVGDNDDLGSVMSNYYKLFAVGTDSAKLRWRRYSDAATGQTLLAGCLPAFDKTSTPRKLIGVSCIDVNTMIDLVEFEAGRGYADFKASMEEDQRYCAPFRLSHSDVQELRKHYNQDSVCEASESNPVVCGDGIVNSDIYGNEQCDDGNTASGDGCSADCRTVEAGWTCPKFGYQMGVVEGYIIRPKLYCSGTDIASSAALSALGTATDWNQCRQDLTPSACTAWCDSADGSSANCVGFSFYVNAWGAKNMCCFRGAMATQELHTGTDCYEKLPTASTASCADNSAFRDERQFRCFEWNGYDCHSAVANWGYTPNGQRDLVDNCASACATCTGNICQPTCSVKVAAPGDCPDCKGAWQGLDTCVNGNVVQQRGGKTECVVQRHYKITQQNTSGGAPCPYNDGDTSFELTAIFVPSAWGACNGACGATGTQTRSAPCLAGTSICNTFGQDYQPVLSQECIGECPTPRPTPPPTPKVTCVTPADCPVSGSQPAVELRAPLCQRCFYRWLRGCEPYDVSKVRAREDVVFRPGDFCVITVPL